MQKVNILKKSLSALIVVNLITLFGCNMDDTENNSDVLSTTVSNEDNEESLEYKLKNISGIIELQKINNDMFNNGEDLLKELSVCEEEVSKNPNLADLKIYGMSQFKQSGEDIQYYIVSGEENINEALNIVESKLEDSDNNSESFRGAHKRDYRNLTKQKEDLEDRLKNLQAEITTLNNDKQKANKAVSTDLRSAIDEYNKTYETRINLEEELKKEANEFRENLISKLNSYLDSGGRSYKKDSAETLLMKKLLLSSMKDLNISNDSFNDEENSRASKWIKKAIAQLYADNASLNVQIKQCNHTIESLKKELADIRKEGNNQINDWKKETEKMVTEINEFNAKRADTLASQKKVIIAEMSSKIKGLNLSAAKSISLLAKLYEYISQIDLDETNRSTQDVSVKKIEVLWGENGEDKDVLSLVMQQDMSEDVAIIAIRKNNNANYVQVIPINS